MTTETQYVGYRYRGVARGYRGYGYRGYRGYGYRGYRGYRPGYGVVRREVRRCALWGAGTFVVDGYIETPNALSRKASANVEEWAASDLRRELLQLISIEESKP